MTIIVDYGMGNLRSVEQALQALGDEAVITSDPERVRSAERLILPGVGAFGDAMASLEHLGLHEAVRQAASSGRPVLGICLGMQLLLDESLEYGRHRGLGLIGGRVVPFSGPEMAGLRVPHIGWNNITAASGSFLEGLADPYMYFVHSFCASGVPPEKAAAGCVYGRPFVCAVEDGNVWGTQFHPEKSGRAGLEILRRFLAQPAGTQPSHRSEEQ